MANSNTDPTCVTTCESGGQGLAKGYEAYKGYRDKEKRRAYMRELMRKRRTEGKAR